MVVVVEQEKKGIKARQLMTLCLPNLVNSVTIATIRSVSLTRQLYTLRMAVFPSANIPTTARVMATSGMSPQSSSTPCRYRWIKSYELGSELDW